MPNDNMFNPSDNRFQMQVARVIDFFVGFVGAASMPIGIWFLYSSYNTKWGATEVIQVCSLAAVFLIALNKNRVPITFKVHFILFLLLTSALADISQNGLMTTTMPLLAVLPILGTIAGGFREGFVNTAVNIAAIVGLITVMHALGLVPNNPDLNTRFDVESWALRIAILAFASCVAVLVTGTLYQLHQVSGEKLSDRDQEISKTQTLMLKSAEFAGLGFAVLDLKKGRITECDATFAEMHGFKVHEILKVNLHTEGIAKHMHADDQERAIRTMEKLADGKVASAEFRYHMPSGETRSVRKIFSPVVTEALKCTVIEVICQDVSEARKLEDQLFQTQKLDAIGKLTGGVAHDFNNLLAVILGNLELLDDLVQCPDQKAMIKDSIASVLRGAELTGNMLSFARKAPLKPVQLNLNQLLRDMNSWIGRTLPSTIEVRTTLQANLWNVVVDPSSTEASLLNLVLNARDAMPDGGCIIFETSNIWVDDELGVDLKPGQYVLLTVSDTGKGISSEEMNHIFEPFFTTKPVGKGSGLGLSMIEGFMRQSKGLICVHSEKGVGTKFELYFSASLEAMSAPLIPRALIFPVGPTNSPTIMIVEDNAEVLKAYKKILTDVGYCVISASSGDEALKVYKTETTIDLLLTDVVMPGKLQGTTLAKAARKMRPNLPVVYMSGYAADALGAEIDLASNDIYLSKPVRREDLLRAVSKTLSLKSES